MKDSLNKVRETLRKKHTQKILARFVSIFSAFVVFITTYALILPAITLELNATCGIEEHQHGDECYEERLICGQEESDGHHHDDSCYEVSRELVCEIPEHQHSADNGCFDADGNLICELSEHVHSDSCYREVKTLVCGMEESDGHHHTDACYEKVLVCGKEAHTHSEACYKNEGSEESEDAASSAQSDTEQVELTSETQSAETDETAAAAEEAVYAEPYIPELDPLNMEAVLTKNTDFYYFHAEEGEEIPADSAFIYDWRPVEKDTELAATDLVKMYLAYSIPAGSLNETNPTARYRLPENIHLTDDQIDAINKNENGITAGFSESDPEYRKYLGAEAVEGDRAPDELLQDGALEYISAVVRAENVYEDGSYLGQDLIFTFIPYTIEKNQTTYDAEQNPLSAGETVTGWFACDFNLDQIDWEEEETIQEVIAEEDESDLADASDSDIDPENETGEEETGQDAAPEDEDELTKDESAEDVLAENLSAEESLQAAEEGKTAETLPAVKKTEKTIIKTADVIFAEKNERENIKEIRRSLRQVEKTIVDLPAEDSQEDSQEEEVQEFKSGTLTAEADGYRIRLDYTEDAKIPEGAALLVREITAETDEEAYESCLEQAREHVSESGDERTEIDTQASRFFDIEIIVTEEDGTSRKIEPAAPVSVNIQIEDAPADSSDSADASKEAQNTDPTVLHFAEDGVEQIESASDSGQKDDAASEGGETTDISFEAESFSIYGVVYTVDFHWEVDGKTYEFIIPGGGFVSLEHLVEVLGISNQGTQSGSGDENETKYSEIEAGNGATTDGNAVHNVMAETGVEDTGTYSDAISLNNVEVSEETKQFVADVASVEFSSPELVWVGKVENETIVDALKEVNGLECEYSAELTIEQIEKINAQTVEAGDWALISLKPFTSEETLTVTMTNGEQFTIKVTDAQLKKTVIDAKGDTWEITVTYGKDAQIPDGAELRVHEITEATEHEAYVTKTQEVLGREIDDSNDRFFDISIIDKDGNEIQPAAKVSVEIHLLDTEIVESMQVVHFGETPELMEVEHDPVSLNFLTDGFSVFAVVVVESEEGSYVFHGEGYTVTITHTAEAKIPLGTILTVEEIDPESDEYIQRLGQAWYEVNQEYFKVEEMRKNYNEGIGDLPELPLINLDHARFFNISLMYENEEIEPEVPVQVEIAYDDGMTMTGEAVSGVVHYMKDAVELIDEVNTVTEGSNVLAFKYEQANISDTGTYVGQKTYDEVAEPVVLPAPEPMQYPMLQKKAATLRELKTAGNGEDKEEAKGEKKGEDADLTAPIATKTLTPNKAGNVNDGTYTLELAVDGRAKSSTMTEIKKSNVLIVMDRSSSMINNIATNDVTQVAWYSNGSFMQRGYYQAGGYSPWTPTEGVTYYGQIYSNGENRYRELFYNNGQFYYYNSQGVTTATTTNYTGNIYTSKTRTRLAEEQEALDRLIYDLLAKNGEGTTDEGVSLEDIIEISVISFAKDRMDENDGAPHPSSEQDWSTEYNDLIEAVNDQYAPSGTNWDQALRYAMDKINEKKQDPTQAGEDYFLVFLTDGEPTATMNEHSGAVYYGSTAADYMPAYEAASVSFDIF